MCKRTNGDNIISVFKDSLLIDSADLAEKCADTGVSFIDNQIIQRIPIISLLLGTVKVGVDICRMVVCHNFSRFITRVRAGEATDIEIKEHLNKLDSPKKLKQRTWYDCRVFTKEYGRYQKRHFCRNIRVVY